jgi:choline dehydrogenase-like flavoprotein
VALQLSQVRARWNTTARTIGTAARKRLTLQPGYRNLQKVQSPSWRAHHRRDTEHFAMKVVDLRALEESVSFQTYLCIVGSGPAGASIAKEFAGSSIQVLVIEGGGAEETPANQALYEVENVGVARTSPQEKVRNRVLGGTSHTWTGRCVSFDDIDFQHRKWVPNSGWPISLADMAPFLERAQKYFGIGSTINGDLLWKKLGMSPPRPPMDPSRLNSIFWQFSRDRTNVHEPSRFSRTIAAIDEPNVKALIYANVTQINTSAEGTRVESLEIKTLEGKRFKVKAKTVVLACGGIENARLLLASNRITPNGVGNANDLVGRFLMDHPGCTLGWFQPNRSAAIQDRFGHYWLDDETGRHVYTHGLALSPELQRKEQLLNCAAFLEQVPSSDDPWRAMSRLLTKLKPVPETPEWDLPRSPGKEIITVVRHLPRVFKNGYRRVRRRAPIIWAHEVALLCLVEQTPDASSRVMLSERKDVLGMPISRIDWRIGELERRSVLRLSELIGLELQRIDLPVHSFNIRLSKDVDWRSNFVDRAHPAGTTRMSNSAERGVVDGNCKVHGVAGLYIAGSSVFPTGGHGNPTLMIVALAIRLADWLKTKELARSTSSWWTAKSADFGNGSI